MCVCVTYVCVYVLVGVCVCVVCGGGVKGLIDSFRIIII